MESLDFAQGVTASYILLNERIAARNAEARAEALGERIEVKLVLGIMPRNPRWVVPILYKHSPPESAFVTAMRDNYARLAQQRLVRTHELVTAMCRDYTERKLRQPAILYTVWGTTIPYRREDLV